MTEKTQPPFEKQNDGDGEEEKHPESNPNQLFERKKSMMDNEEITTQPENLMQNLNPNKLKQLIEAHVGGGPFSEAILERKKYSFELLKAWDSRKCDLLMDHKNILENFVKKIEKKQEFLKNAMATVVKFFTQKVNQETDYLSYFQKKIPKLTNIYRETSNIPLKKEKVDLTNGEVKPILPDKNDFFPKFSQCFDTMDAIFLSKQQQIEKYKTTLEKDILKELLIKENQEYDKAVDALRDEIITVRKKLYKANNLTADNSSKHAKLFTEMLESSSKLKLENQDLYNSEVILLSTSDNQINLQKAMAKSIMDFWENLEALEINRLKVIQKALQEFLVLSEDYFGPSVEYDNLRDLLLNLEFTEDLEKFLNIENYFSNDDRSYLSRFLPEFSFANLKAFLSEFKSEPIESSPLVVKEFLVERDCSTMLTKSFKQCKIVLTVDNNILLFDDPIENEKKPANSILKIENIVIKRRNETGVIELQEKVKGFIFSSTNSYVFRIYNTDIYDEIIIYLEFIKLRKWF